MNQSDMDAIRKRDSEWKEIGSPRFSVAARDRRALLKHIDELESAAAQIQDDLVAIKRVHREHYVAKPADRQSAPPPNIEEKVTPSV